MFITIYQEVNPTFRVDSNKKLYKIGDYKEVYEMEWNRYELPNDKDILEALFATFNQPPYPPSYRGHSMSVGDIVEIRDHKDFTKGSRKYICDSFGWNKIEWVQD